MPEPQTTPYGTWKSPINSDLIVSDVVRLSDPVIDGRNIYWTELRPTEGGRLVLVNCTPDGTTTDVTPPGYNVRTRVHEYGGAAFVVRNGTVWFSNFDDQRLYRQKIGMDPVPITAGADLRWADGVLDETRNRIICVQEDHTVAGREAENTIVGLDLDQAGPGEIVTSGCDFYSNPRLSPDGTQLAWMEWNHPNMPWDGTALCVAQLDDTGRVSKAERIAGSMNESVLQPLWSPDGMLYFISDRNGWWNLYRWTGGSTDSIIEKRAEFAGPSWVFGLASYGFESPESLLCVYSESGQAHLTRINTRTLDTQPIKTPFTSIRYLKVFNGQAVFLGGSPTAPSAVVRLDLASGSLEALRRSSTVGVDSDYLSIPESIEFPTEGGQTAHAFYYAPANGDFQGPADESPPLLVRSHGGPTSAATRDFNLSIQYWTSRGFAFVDVNYGGSTGHGREYRNRLRGNWGIVDVDDCVNAAQHLVRQGLADPDRLAIDGGSAGGYTTLCALTLRNVFAAGASLYGLSDLVAFVGDTHKFESRYLDSLIGPWPEREDLYRARSAINSVDQLSCPVAFFQGDEDKIVPPNQAELMVDALRKKGLPVTYVLFEGEQHGFHKAANIKRTLDGEFYFFSRFFGFDPADNLEPLEIENLD
ncbi:MAG TPA: S9 family peptidase [Pirellulaceae bacterium]|jgi:dipeptidyl aminopeptidase/acylaminoacyl peptidase|nr:S9 family peptidase [Pirellulaceae bacterium]